MRPITVCAAAILSVFGGTLGAAADAPRFGASGPADLHALDLAPAGPEARKELSVKREENFEFAAEPAVRRAGDRIEIDFETKAYCDATVALETAGGKVVRHLASGVLGDNAPAPFKTNTKKQHVVRDGKDDFGAFIDDKDALVVRVSLGLRASFEKNLHCSPMQVMGPHPIMHASPQGVFVYIANVNHAWDSLQLFDHEAKYVKTVCPFPANTLDKIKGLNWVYAWPEDRRIPAKSFDLHGSLLPFKSTLYDKQPLVGDFALKDGWVTLLGRPKTARLATDGTTRGRELVGASTSLTTIKYAPMKSFARRSATSLDGRWTYLTRAYGGRVTDEGDNSGQIASVMDHAVYRIPADGLADPQVFLGDPHNKGSDNEHFNTPSGIAVDPQGRIYVSDWDNDRVQVFSAEGKFIKALPAVGPADITINQKTGDIYVFGWLLRWKVYGYAAEVPQMWRAGEGQDGDYNLRGCPVRVRKYTPLDAEAKLVYEQKLIYDGKLMDRGTAHAPWSRAEVDAWAPQPMLWMCLPTGQYNGWTRLVVWKEENNALTLQYDFDKECEKAGVRTECRYMRHSGPLQRQFLYFDPKHQVLYVGEPNMREMKYFDRMVAIDVATARESVVKLPFEAADAAIDAKGRIYLLNDDVAGRFDLDPSSTVASGEMALALSRMRFLG